MEVLQREYEKQLDIYKENGIFKDSNNWYYIKCEGDIGATLICGERDENELCEKYTRIGKVFIEY